MAQRVCSKLLEDCASPSTCVYFSTGSSIWVDTVEASCILPVPVSAWTERLQISGPYMARHEILPHLGAFGADVRVTVFLFPGLQISWQESHSLSGWLTVFHPLNPLVFNPHTKSRWATSDKIRAVRNNLLTDIQSIINHEPQNAQTGSRKRFQLF